MQSALIVVIQDILLINAFSLLDTLLDGRGQEEKDLFLHRLLARIFEGYPLQIILLFWSKILALPTLFSLKSKSKIYSLLRIAFPTKT